MKVFGASGICSALLIGLFSSLPVALAHGTHIWFVSPLENAVLHDKVLFVVEAPYARNHYIYLTVSKQGDATPAWQGLVTLEDKKYTMRLNVSGWSRGRYSAEVILLGALVQHPVRRDFYLQ